MMKLFTAIVGVILSILSIVALMITVFLFQEERHAAKAELEEIRKERLEEDLRVRSEIIDRDIKKDAEANVYYQNVQMVRDLTKPEEIRVDYIEKQMARKDKEQDEIQRQLSELDK